MYEPKHDSGNVVEGDTDHTARHARAAETEGEG